ncbi:MAG: hypothetical protein ABUL47_01810 [Leifsonia sp.]
MRRRAAVASVVASAGVLIAGFQIGSAVSAARSTAPAATGGSTATTGGPGGTSGATDAGTTGSGG